MTSKFRFFSRNQQCYLPRQELPFYGTSSFLSVIRNHSIGYQTDPFRTQLHLVQQPRILLCLKYSLPLGKVIRPNSKVMTYMVIFMGDINVIISDGR